MDKTDIEKSIGLIISGTEEEKERAADVLIEAGRSFPEQTIAALQPLETDRDARWWQARILAEIPGSRAGAYLVSLLCDPDEDTSVCAILALGERRQADSVENLYELMLPSNAYVARHIGDALSKIGEPAVPALIQALQNDRPLVRAEAARALVRIESQQSIPALIRALDDPEPAVEHHAWNALQRMGVGETIFFKP